MHKFKLVLWFASITLILLASTYLFSDIITPFFIAFLFAYLFAPFAEYLEKKGLGRNIGALTILIITISFIILLILLISPLIIKQISGLVHIAINHKTDFSDFFAKYQLKYHNLDPAFIEKINKSIEEFSSEMLNLFVTIIQSAIHTSSAAVNTISLVLITPIVFYYMLADWRKMTDSIYSLIPSSLKGDFKHLSREIQYTMSGYIRGQLLVCFTMALFYSAAFTIMGVDSGFALGIFCGIITFIPYVGAIFSSFISCLVVAMQFGTIDMILVVLAVFTIAQLIEGYLLVPKLIGERVHLHPVWIMFGLMAGGSLLGFFGVLIALPLTAFLSVLIRFGLGVYKKSALFN